MIQRIEVMVKGMGEMSLDALQSWFPRKNRDEILTEVRKSSNLIIDGSVVKYGDYIKKKNFYQDVKIIEKDIDLGGKVSTKVKEETPINKIEKEVESTTNTTNNTTNNVKLSSHEFFKVIDNYNKSIEQELYKLNQLNYNNKARAIKKYYDERFILEVSDTDFGDNCEFIILKHKQKGVELGYLLIADRVSKDVIDKIYMNYRYDTVYFCQLDEGYSKFELPLGEYYYKDCNELITNYMPKYVMKKKMVEVYDIVKE